MSNSKKKYILLSITILWMAMIFYFSSQPVAESSAISVTVTQKIVDVTNEIYNNNPPKVLTDYIFASDHFVRKSGHTFEFFILGILMIICLRKFSVKMPAAFTIVICFFYAASDEFHQIFVPGRGPLVTDVLLDTISSAIGVALVLCILKFGRRKKSVILQR